VFTCAVRSPVSLVPTSRVHPRGNRSAVVLLWIAGTAPRVEGGRGEGGGGGSGGREWGGWRGGALIDTLG
jgi:hypothetical protein